MTNTNPNEEAVDVKDFTQYLPERDYKAHGRHLYGTVKGFKAIGPTEGGICDSCVKYYINLHKRGLKNNPNTPPCRGHATRVYDDVIDQLEDEKSQEILRLSADPVAWAYSEFDFESRFYQNEASSCTAYKKVLRQGRRCVTGNTKVLTQDGYKEIKEVQLGDLVATLNLKTKKKEFQKVINVFENGIQDIYRVTFSSRKSIECTNNHPFLRHVSLHWQTIEDGLEEGHDVCFLDESTAGSNEEDISPVKIKSIEFIGKKETYDIEVFQNHNFIANDLVTANSGKTTVSVVDILHKVIFNKNFKVLILTPFMSQIELIFGMIDEFLAKSKNVSSSVISATKNPFRRRFTNNSYILGYAIKPGDPTAVDKIRGSDADYLYLDEVDFLDPAHIEVVMPITMKDNCYVLATSTPKGTKTHWWRWVTMKDLNFKEFHYISAERPDWNQDKAEFFGRSSTQAKYSREYDAEFAVAELGVFRKDLVDASLREYDLESIKPDYSKVSIMGVDWNITTGAHIVIVAWDGKKFKLVHKTIINPDEFAQTAAVEKVIELNAYWKPQWIFVDDGAGSTQVELLKRYGMSNKDSKLDSKVIPINMSSNLEIWNPAENVKEKKYAKHFMVNNSVKYVEDGVVMLPISEDTSVTIDENDKSAAVGVGLVQQMRNYEVKRFSSLGRPIYSQGYEHTLTAWMLAILGFTLKNTDFGSPDSKTMITDYSYRVSEGIKRKQEEDITLINRTLESQGPMNVPKVYTDPETNNGRKYIPTNIPNSTKQSLEKQKRPIQEFRSKASYKKGSMRKHF